MQQVQSIQSVPLLTAHVPGLAEQFGECELELSNAQLLRYTKGAFDYERALLCVGARYVPNLKQQELTIYERYDGFRVSIRSICRGDDPNNSISMFRTFEKSDSGDWYLENDGFNIGSNLRRTGIGTHIFASQVLNAAKCGIKRITTQATRSYNHNGYYTWARLGYDAQIVSYIMRLTSSIRQSCPELKDKQEPLYVSDLMKTAAGRAWWMENGYDQEMIFDLTDGSQSRQVLEEYLKEKGYYVQ